MLRPCTHPAICTSVDVCIHTFTYTCIQARTWPSMHLSIHLCAQPRTRASIPQVIYPSMPHPPMHRSMYPCTHSCMHLSVHVLIRLSIHLTDIHGQPIICQTHPFSLTWSPTSMNNWPLFSFGNVLFSRLPRTHSLLVLLLPYLSLTSVPKTEWTRLPPELLFHWRRWQLHLSSCLSCKSGRHCDSSPVLPPHMLYGPRSC